MNWQNKNRGLSKNTMSWVYGYYYEEAAVNPNEPSRGFIIDPKNYGDVKLQNKFIREEIHISTLGKCTGCIDKWENELYQNDIIMSELNKSVFMIIRFGEYKAYSPSDNAYTKNVGFYAEANGYAPMPLGNTNKQALIGNIHENPDLFD